MKLLDLFILFLFIICFRGFSLVLFIDSSYGTLLYFFYGFGCLLLAQSLPMEVWEHVNPMKPTL